MAAYPTAIGGARGCSRVAMGAVRRVAISFRSAPWEAVDSRDEEKLEKLSFLHTPGGAFNVWWTAYPLAWPLAIAWSGGPSVAALGAGNRRTTSAALAELAQALGLSRRAVASRVEGSWTHDWQRDRWSRGAYSHARVGGTGAARALSRPIESTLFFAGEAADAGGRTGTVEGALASGLRAARQVLGALGR